MQEIYACGIWNPGIFCSWNPESWVLKSGIQLKESGISLTIGIQSPVLLTNTRIRYLEDCPGFPYMGQIVLNNYVNSTEIFVEMNNNSETSFV